MKEQLTPIAVVICKWLGWHWLDKSKQWEYDGVHAPCRLCHRIISR